MEERVGKRFIDVTRCIEKHLNHCTAFCSGGEVGGELRRAEARKLVH